MTVTAKALIEAKYAASSGTTEYTVPANTRTIIDKFTATNTDASSRTLAIHIVASTDVSGGNNMIIQDVSIAAGATYDSAEMKNQILNAGDFLSISASVASKVVIRASGREVT